MRESRAVISVFVLVSNSVAHAFHILWAVSRNSLWRFSLGHKHPSSMKSAGDFLGCLATSTAGQGGRSDPPDQYLCDVAAFTLNVVEGQLLVHPVHMPEPSKDVHIRSRAIVDVEDSMNHSASIQEEPVAGVDGRGHPMLVDFSPGIRCDI